MAILVCGEKAEPAAKLLGRIHIAVLLLDPLNMPWYPRGTMAAANGVNGHTASAIYSLDELQSHAFDYLIVGGGTAGLVLAARLTENPDVHVGVLEAGQNRLDDMLVSVPALFSKLLGTPDGTPDYDGMLELYLR